MDVPSAHAGAVIEFATERKAEIVINHHLFQYEYFKGSITQRQTGSLKAKKLTNMRAAGSDRKMRIAPAVRFSLEEALEFLRADEYVEVTPKSIRLRKAILDELSRRRAAIRAGVEGGGE